MKRIGILLALAVLTGALAPTATHGATARDRAKLRAMLNRLETTLVNVNFEDTTLEEGLKHISRFSGVNLVISPKLRGEIDPASLTLTLTLTKVTAKQALKIILDFKDLGMVYRHGVLMVTTKEDARGKPIMRVYSIADLTFKLRDFPGPDLQLKPSGTTFDEEEEVAERDDPFEDPEFIADIIRSNVDPESWEADGVSIQAYKKALIVKQSAANHVKIARLLQLLRAAK
jgi:hypothetical protein